MNISSSLFGALGTLLCSSLQKDLFQCLNVNKDQYLLEALYYLEIRFEGLR